VLHPFAVLSAPNNTLANFDVVINKQSANGNSERQYLKHQSFLFKTFSFKMFSLK